MSEPILARRNCLIMIIILILLKHFLDNHYGLKRNAPHIGEDTHHSHSDLVALAFLHDDQKYFLDLLEVLFVSPLQKQDTVLNFLQPGHGYQ